MGTLAESRRAGNRKANRRVDRQADGQVSERAGWAGTGTQESR